VDATASSGGTLTFGGGTKGGVSSFRFSVFNDAATASGLSFAPLFVERALDDASNKLYGAALDGSFVEPVNLAPASSPASSYDLGTAAGTHSTVSSYTLNSTSYGGDAPWEDVSFDYTSFKLTVGAESFCWDVAQAKQC
jgi:hypothetical protein